MNDTKLNSETLISYHSFLLPFRWDCASPRYEKKSAPTVFDINLDYRERLNAETFHDTLRQNGKWEYSAFEINVAEDYNEYVYFYPHARKALFNVNPGFKKGAASYCFRYKDGDCKYCNIYIKGGRNYSLTVDAITLTIFETGIGILQFGLENHRYGDHDDILIINDFGRRIYPQFIGDFHGPENCRGIEAARNGIYPNLTEISFDEASEKYTPCDMEASHYNDPANLNPSKSATVQILPVFIQRLLGSRFKTDITAIQPDDILITPVIDDRMFVMCVYGDTVHPSDKENQYLNEHLNQHFWHKFLFVDGKGKGAANRQFEEELIRKHSYGRWTEYGTRYGISRYSFMVWINGSLTGNDPKMILTHCKTMYLKAVFLSLTQRASIIRFSEEIAHISELNDQDTEKIRGLHKNYIRFVNKFYFSEVTAQEQGIEIFDMIQNHMKIKENMATLREEIGDLHAYADLIAEKKRGRAADRLNWIVVIFLIPTLITGLFGMNVFGNEKTWFFGFSAFNSNLSCFVLLLYVVVLAVIFFTRKRKESAIGFLERLKILFVTRLTKDDK